MALPFPLCRPESAARRQRLRSRSWCAAARIRLSASGTSGGIDTKVHGGDLILASAAVRGDGTSKEYLPPDYPAVADFDVLCALKNAADSLCDGSPGNAYHIGVVQSKDSFYGETNPETMPVAEYLQTRWESYVRCGCLTSEMECATLFSVGIARKVRVGGVITAIWT